MKNINELTHTKKPLPPELIEELEEISVALKKNSDDIRDQIADAEREIMRRRNLGENI